MHAGQSSAQFKEYIKFLFINFKVHSYFFIIIDIEEYKRNNCTSELYAVI